MDFWDRSCRERENTLLLGFLGLVVSQETSHQEHPKILHPCETNFFLTFGKTKLGVMKYFAFSGAKAEQKSSAFFFKTLPWAPSKGLKSGERVPADPAARAPSAPHHRGAALGPRAAGAARGPPEPSSAGQSAAVSSAAAMLPAARALPPRLPRRPPLAWRWAAAGPPAAGLRALGTSRARRSEALAGAPLDTAAKEYSPKVRQLVRDIAGLTLLEVADLNALLKVGGEGRPGPARPSPAHPIPARLGPARPACAASPAAVAAAFPAGDAEDPGRGGDAGGGGGCLPPALPGGSAGTGSPGEGSGAGPRGPPGVGRRRGGPWGLAGCLQRALAASRRRRRSRSRKRKRISPSG